MSDSYETHPDSVTVSARVILLEVKPKHAGSSIEVKLVTSYSLEKMKGFAEAMMRAREGDLKLFYVPDQSELFPEEGNGEGEGQQEFGLGEDE